jgi:hypothetical protein
MLETIFSILGLIALLVIVWIVARFLLKIGGLYPVRRTNGHPGHRNPCYPLDFRVLTLRWRHSLDNLPGSFSARGVLELPGG